jgi:hypothetical protein
MLLFVVILPGVTAYFSKRRGIPVRNINLQVARSSLVLLSAGCTFVGMSKSARFLIPGLHPIRCRDRLPLIMNNG